MDKLGMTKKKSVRVAVVDAALDLMEASETANPGQLTLEAVAAKAGVSKGGLLHHFKSKEALLTAMVERLAGNFEAERLRGVASLSANVGDPGEHEVELISAYLDRGFSGLGESNRSAMTLFAAATHEQSLLQPIRDLWARRNEEALNRSENAHALIALTLLADGLWIFDCLGIPPVTGKLREELLVTIKGWARQVIEGESKGSSRKPVKKEAKPVAVKKAAKASKKPRS